MEDIHFSPPLFFLIFFLFSFFCQALKSNVSTRIISISNDFCNNTFITFFFKFNLIWNEIISMFLSFFHEILNLTRLTPNQPLKAMHLVRRIFHTKYLFKSLFLQNFAGKSNLRVLLYLNALVTSVLVHTERHSSFYVLGLRPFSDIVRVTLPRAHTIHLKRLVF